MIQWRKFELKMSYILKVIDFWIFWIFYLIFIDFSLFEKGKRGGFYLYRTRRADVACRTRTYATWHTRPCGRAARAHTALVWRRGGVDAWQGHASPRGCLGGTEVAQMCGRATRVHMDARVAPRGSERAGRWRAHGLVGLGYSIGAVTHFRSAAPPFILTLSLFFFHVGLCSREILICKTRGSFASVGCKRIKWRASIVWTRVHPIVIRSTRAKWSRWSRKWNIGRFGFIMKLAHRGATCGGITTVRLKSDGWNERRNVGPRRGIMGHLTRAIVAVQSSFIRSNGLRFSQRFLL